MSKREFGIYIPSYKRAATISTHKLLEYYKVVVRKSEETEYLKVIPKENLIAVPDEEMAANSRKNMIAREGGNE